MESTIVIKVNYGKTLRRFNACVDEAGKLELSLDGLRQKVISLFSLSPEVDLTLTYLDEDGDSVTLADDDDLSDVMMQSLNPLRITAEVNSEKGNTSFSASARSSGNSTPIRSSPKISQPLPDLNHTFSEIFEAVPEPLRETLTKLSLDLASKAVSSTQLPELVQHISKMLQSNMKAQFVGAESSSPSSITKELESLRGDSAIPKVIVVPQNSSNQRSGYERKADAVFGNSGTNTPYFPKMLKSHMKAQSVGAESSTPSSMAKLEALGGVTVKPKVVDVPNSVNQPSGYENKTDPIFNTPVFNTFVATEPSPFAAKVGQLSDDKEQVKKSDQDSLEQEALKAPLEDFKTDSYPFKNVSFGGNTSARPFNHNIARQCPFGRVPNDLVSSYNPFAPQLAPPLRRNSHGGVDGVFHTGIVCDGCKACPITGPRFKSKVKENYDLCSICFAKMGSEADYIRLDHPVPYRHHPFKGPLHPSFVQNSRVNPPPTLPQALKNVVKPKLPKLDSRFVMDVNVIDGTMMAPLTSFTKIWRMRNNGTLVWPHGSQLVWIGGDKLSASLSTELQIPVDGIAVENELEVAVDFTTPELPGRYISYWRMATPSGQKFGQRVWVLIQVDASAKDSSCNSNSQGLNLNFPPQNEVESVAINAKPVIVDGRLPIIEPSNINFEHIAVDGRIPIPEPSNNADDLVEPLVVTVPTKDQNIDFPINDNLLVSGANTQVVGPTTVSYPIVDSSAVPSVSAFFAPPTPFADAEKWEEAWSEKEDDGVEQILLKELEEMGFKQVDLNKEILRMNEYNLEQSVDDLCGVSKWDPILKELQEMGFCDNEVNKKLLKKNNGSIKDVVMDLINGEKA